MVTNYYTLKALAEAWSKDLKACIVGDVYSQSRDELTIALASPQKTWMLRASTHPAMQFIFRSEGYNKAKRNVAALFGQTLDKKVTGIRLAERDRVLFIELDEGFCLQLMLFGPRANVLLVDSTGTIVDAFQRKEELLGTPAPPPTPAAEISTLEHLVARWKHDRKNTMRAISSAFPFFNAHLSKEIFLRAGNLPDKPAHCTPDDLQRIYNASLQLTAALCAPAPRIYWRGQRALQFSLIPLTQEEDVREEPFEDIDKAVTIYVRRRLGQRAFDAVFEPLEKALSAAHRSHTKRLETMLASLSEESRAEKYERWGHLLMASQSEIPQRVDQVELVDLFVENNASANQRTTIPLDTALSPVENAQRYYEKARKTRLSRSHAEERLEQTERRALEAEALLTALRKLKTKAEVQKFEKNEEKRLAHFLGHQVSNQPQVPFRRFELAGGYEVWVGKNAKQNDLLTFQYARKFDFWMHARGVPGSHTVLRRPGRTATPNKQVVEQAASIAAFYSKARGSHLVPVIMTERKFVRKPKGASIGTVIVEKEQVLLVEPGLPA